MKQSTRRFLAHGSNATLVTIMAIAVMVMVYVLADQTRVRWDFSAEQANTLSPDTLGKLALLDKEGVPVEITAFTSQSGKDESWFKDRSVRDLLAEIDRSSAVITWRQVDYDKERLTAEALGVSMYGQIVITRGADRVDIKERELFKRVGKVADNKWDFLGESALNRGLAQLLTPRRRVVYVLTGHGDLDPEERGPTGLSNLVAALDAERFEVETLDLLRTGDKGSAPDVPDDAALVFVARPKAPLTPQEEDVLLGWLGRGKPLMVALDAESPPPSLLGRLGVSLLDGVAMDEEVLFPYRDRPLARYKPHPITQDLREDSFATVLVGPLPVKAAEPPPQGMIYAPVLSTSRRGWIERGGALESGLAVYQPEIDGAGPADMALAVEVQASSGLVRKGKPSARVLVVGDAEAFTNALLEEGPGNTAFAINAVQWLAGEDDRLGLIPGRTTSVRRLALTKDDAGRLRWVSLGVMPLVVALFGLATWMSRRGR